MNQMLCYKDKTFCHSDCINRSCWRYLTDEDRRRSVELKMPISSSDYSRTCTDYKEPTT